jgi:hypothetical protein
MALQPVCYRIFRAMSHSQTTYSRPANVLFLSSSSASPSRRMKTKALPIVPLHSHGNNVVRITTYEPNFEKLQYAIIVKQDNNDGLNRRHGSGGNIRIPLILTSFKNDQHKNTVLFPYRGWRPCLRPCTAISDIHRFRRIVGEPQIDTFRYVTTEEDLQKYKRDAQGSDFAH